MSLNYIPLDGETATLFNHPISFTVGSDVTSLYTVSVLLLLLFLVLNGGAAMVRILYALGLMVGPFGEASEAKYTKAKKITSDVLFALLFSFGLVLFTLAVNPDIARGNVDLAKLWVGSSVNQSAQTQARVGSGGVVSTSCPNTDTYKSNLASGGNVCAGVTCTAMSGCNLSPYASIIETEASRQGVNPNLVKAIMCRESKGVTNATHVNNPPTNIDCGLMQINKRGPACDISDLDPATNIRKGVSLIKEKYAAISQTYPGIQKEMMVLASYNCCGTEGSPNKASVDCTTASGFPNSLPRWACPINPGPTATNMCFVRGYICDVYACAKQLGL